MIPIREGDVVSGPLLVLSRRGAVRNRYKDPARSSRCGKNMIPHPNLFQRLSILIAMVAPSFITFLTAVAWMTTSSVGAKVISWVQDQGRVDHYCSGDPPSDLTIGIVCFDTDVDIQAHTKDSSDGLEGYMSDDHKRKLQRIVQSKHHLQRIAEHLSNLCNLNFLYSVSLYVHVPDFVLLAGTTGQTSSLTTLTHYIFMQPYQDDMANGVFVQYTIYNQGKETYQAVYGPGSATHPHL